MPQPEVLVEVRRGELVEARHRGHAVMVDKDGRRLYACGDPGHVTYMRSAAKPLQALPLVETGAARRLGLAAAELAVCCASHNGEPEHITVVRSILDRAGIAPEMLRCGTHPAWDARVRDALIMAGEKPGVLHNNCSGKHAGMLALAAHMNWPLEGYTAREHPLQQMMVRTVAELAGVPAEGLIIGIDGCTVPTFGLPLYNMALAYARLADPAGLGPERAAASAAVADAMGANPHLVAGTGRFCTDLIRITGGRLIGKVGAEAVYCVAVRDRGWGLAVKVEDGGQRGLYPAVLQVLDSCGLLRPDELDALQDYHRPAVRNNRGEVVGRVEPATP